MELTTPERVLFETEVYEIDDDLKVKRGNVKITESRIMFRSNGNAKLLYISGIQMVEIKKENRWGFFAGGLIFLVSSAIMYLLGLEFGVGSFTSALMLFVLPTAFLFVSLLLLYWWFVTRSYLLDMHTNFGRKLRIRSKSKEDLYEIANAVELVKMGAVRMLQRKERQFV
ncbi:MULTISPECIES: hypothetical protein [Archaeoglobus]|jgi:hypothetical protein|uniref:Uncharacterized protein AF_1266 n=3 Tax=Archaeoglobus fulgidus TaxID=2234 RepID=Y1266_ARCFU|nr:MULTISPECIES: hypothetical protein [Archaeoglobus]O29002.1 RecName: Full=Uncharacterized protein AF_1266 [Archaeoglobus fulgidus DSM 4304]AAB89990.1 predicted coding region AF_1266 [Archaeoglobus fulgidus DSM 4304]AIG98136.1 hypothetical protein AFULGI_00013650 [Archaeoglobus fulgidus DSM 8774]KUJ92471.1 MAG: hypothetical protein XD40_2336 [Archaeoglobus fulgidus]KUK05335.1 MAG: Uncharacterized protein XD48_2430 [Archaeoglobus fulgidus]MDI3498690.1 hypothetical protein [Archaeoglobus sp.]